MKYYNDYFSGYPQDDFGWSPEWCREIGKWLEYIHSLDKKFYERNKNRIYKDDHRDALLGEIKAIYCTGNILGLKIVEIEPSGKGSSILDFSFEDLSGDLWEAEVKSPSWKGQVWKDSAMTKSEKMAREIQPKVRNGDGGSFSSDEEIRFAIEDSVKNTAYKLNKGENNLLIITPYLRQDTFVMLAISAMASKHTVVQDEVSLGDPDGVISAVLILEPQFPLSEGKVVYNNDLTSISSTPKIK